MATPAHNGATQIGLATAFRRCFDFSGRASRSALTTYLLASLLISVPVSFVTALVLPRDLHAMAKNLLVLVFAVPMPALLARRFHDHGRSAAWVWLAVFSFALWLARTLVAMALGPDARAQMDSWIGLVDWLVLIANLATVLLALIPGTAGPNRFGPPGAS